MKTLEKTDIIIVGGGLTGQIMARALAVSGYNITCITQPVSTKSASKDTRTTTIHAAGQRMLDALGIWSLCIPMPEPITHIIVGAQTSARNGAQNWPLKFSTETKSSDAGPMAYTVHNQALSDALKMLKPARCLQTIEAQISSIDFSAELPIVTLQDGTILSCDLIIGCDGASSFTRQQAGLNVWPRTTNQKAIVTRITAEHHHQQTAYQRFLPDGPLAFMPLQQNDLALVWSLSEARADSLLSADTATFETALQKDFGSDLGQLALSKADGNIRQAWPLRPTIVPRLTSKGLVLAGDAAHALHPLAGMGFNLALADMAVLLDILCHSYRLGLPAGHASNLSQYTHKRRAEILAMSAVTEGLNRLFSYNVVGKNQRGAAYFAKIATFGMQLVGKSRLHTQISKLAMGGILSPASLLDGVLPHMPKMK